MQKGYIQIYTGNGKGKTTAALGLAIRAAGSGMKVKFVQFLKGAKTSELTIIEQINNIEIYRPSTVSKFFWNLNEEDKLTLKQNTQLVLDKVLLWAQKGEADLIILDEALGALQNSIINRNYFEQLFEKKCDNVELVITGRGAPDWIINRADLVSEILPIKHYKDNGVRARLGIEY